MKHIILYLLLSISFAYGQTSWPNNQLYTVSGTDTYSVTPVPVATLKNGFTLGLKFTNANTTAATLDVSTLGDIPLTTNDGTALTGGEIAPGAIFIVKYDLVANQWRITGGLGGSSVNIYNSDGVVTGDRIVDADGNSFTIDNANVLTLNSDNDVLVNANGGFQVNSDAATITGTSDVILNSPQVSISQLATGTGNPDEILTIDEDGKVNSITGTTVSDGDKGDITVSSSGTVWTIDNLAVTNAKINDVSASKITGILPVANGGTGTATPSLVAGTDITVTGSWPNQTVSSSATGGAQLGTLINETFSNITNFTKVGTVGGVFTPSGGALTISNTADNLTEYIRQSNYGSSTLEDWTVELDATVPTITTTSRGFDVGAQSQAVGGGFPYSWQFGLDMTTANSGTIRFQINNSTTLIRPTTLATPPRLTISAGNSIHFIVRSAKSKFIVTVINVTTGYSITDEISLTISYPYASLSTPNVQQFSIYARGDATVVDNFVVSSQALKNQNWLFGGDSITEGAVAGNKANRYPDRLTSMVREYCGVYARQGSKIEDLNVTEILTLAPSNIFLLIGTNNVGAGDNVATFQSKYTTLTNALVAGGYVLGTNLFIGLLQPRSVFDVTSYNASLVTNYPTAVIDTWTPFKAASGTGPNTYISPDLLHPTEAGHRLMADILLTRLPSKFTMKSNPQVDYNAFIPSTTYTKLDVVDAPVSQMRISASNAADVGGYFTSAADHQLIMSGGAKYNGTNWVASATTSSSVFASTGGLDFTGNSSLTVGNTFTPTSRMAIDANGVVNIKGSTRSNTLFGLGGSLTSLATGGMNIGGGVHYDGTSWKALGTTSTLISIGNNQGAVAGMSFYINSGNTIGNTVSLTEVGRWGVNGLYLGGGAAAASKLEIAAGTSTVAALGLTSGTDLSSPTAGKFYFNGTRLGFSPSTTIKRIPLSNDAAPTNGQLMIGNGTDYTVASLTAGTGITVTPGSGTITIAATATGGVVTDRITVSSAEILNLNSSPKQLIAAPGSGNIIQLLGITAKYVHVTTGYSVSTGIAGTMGGQGYWNVDGFLNTGADRYSMTGGVTNQDSSGVPQSTTTSFVNQPFMLTSTGGNPTGGDGTLIISVTYKIIPL